MIKLKAPKLLSLIEAGEYVRNEAWSNSILFIGLNPEGKHRFFHLTEGVMEVFRDEDEEYDTYIPNEVVRNYNTNPWTIYKEGETT